MPTLRILSFAALAFAATGASAGTLPAGFAAKDATVNGTTIHYTIGGTGSPIVLLHGYAETSHMWLPLMPLLSGKHTVIVPDLRGGGQSAHPEGGYDKKNMAVDIHEIVKSLGFERAAVVGHDIGLMVAYAYAAQFPAGTEKLVLMDAFLPGVGDWTSVWLMRDLWHFHFYGPVPLALVEGRERIYFEHFWNDFAADPTKSLSEADRQFYAAEYAREGGMRSGFEWFRNFERDAKDFAQLAKTPLTMPVLVLTGEKASGEGLIVQTKLVASNVTGVVIKGSGHWLMEEAREPTVAELVKFLN